MSNFPTPQLLSTALSATEQRHLLPNPTLGDLDLAYSPDLQELMGPIEERIVGRFCQSLDFTHDEPFEGKVRLFFSATTPCTNGRRESPDDGPYWASELVTEKFDIVVRRETEIARIVEEVESAVRGIDGNDWR